MILKRIYSKIKFDQRYELISSLLDKEKLNNKYISELKDNSNPENPFLSQQEKDNDDEEEAYTIEQLQDYISLGIAEYIRDATNDLTAKSLIEDSLEQMLKFSNELYTKEQILEDIEPLNHISTQKFYKQLKHKVLSE